MSDTEDDSVTHSLASSHIKVGNPSADSDQIRSRDCEIILWRCLISPLNMQRELVIWNEFAKVKSLRLERSFKKITCIYVHRMDLIALGCMKLARCSYHSYLIIIVPSYL